MWVDNLATRMVLVNVPEIGRRRHVQLHAFCFSKWLIVFYLTYCRDPTTVVTHVHQSKSTCMLLIASSLICTAATMKWIMSNVSWPHLPSPSKSCCWHLLVSCFARLAASLVRISHAYSIIMLIGFCYADCGIHLPKLMLKTKCTHIR